jgi:type IV secretion system protein VirB8
MTDATAGGSKPPLVNDSYYSDGARWERDVYRRIELSRNAWRLMAFIMGLGLFAALACLTLLIPLKSTDVVTLVVDKATGFVEVAKPLEAGGPISEREAVTQANIVRFIRARETYDPPALRDNFELASLLSAGTASKDLQDQFSGGNPQNPMTLYGASGRIKVVVQSVNFLTNGWMQEPGKAATAAVRFTTIRTTDRETITEHWAGNVRFRYSVEPIKNQWRFDNPLGFQAVEYRKDQETVAPLAGSNP